MDMVCVNRINFYKNIGNVYPKIIGKYPYTSVFYYVNTNIVYGKIVSNGFCKKYYLTKKEIDKLSLEKE